MKLENMDGMTIEELSDYIDLLDLARQYAAKKYVAMNYRQQGIITFAQDLENQCEKIYNQIPLESRW